MCQRQLLRRPRPSILRHEGGAATKTTANGITVNYELTGQGNCLVLVHGAGDNLQMWYGQVPVFSQRYGVLTYDVRGFGETEFPEAEVGAALLAADLRALLRALDIPRAFVLGYSMGGRIALELALDAPEMVRALVLSNSGIGVGPRPPGAEERRRGLIDALERGDLETAAEQMTAASFSPGLKERDPALFERYKRIKLANNPRSFARVWGAMMRASPPDVSRLSCPVLLIAGERDGFMSLEAARSTHAAIAGSHLELLPTGHAAALEAPQEFNRLIFDFLAGIEKKERT
ncbi:MAG: alpha/beta hydrolase [Dehalococcoidia bacterium]|jgi:pimeloyl-ACP methyl ester carboxylesterase